MSYAKSDRYELFLGDSREVLKSIPEASIDAVVTDPPYALTNVKMDSFGCKSCGRRMGGPEKVSNPCPRCGGEMVRQRSASGSGFMGKKWDTGETAFDPSFWSEVLRVLKPGAHLLAFGGTRTYHRLVCAIEDAGFEIRDQVAWLYGSGFPKSHDVSKAIDKAAGAEGEYGAPKSVAHAGWIDRGAMRGDAGHEGYQRPWMQDEQAVDRAAR